MNTLPQVKQGGKLYSIGDLVGKSIIADESTPVYRLPIKAEILKGWYKKGRPALLRDSVYASKDFTVYTTTGSYYRTAKKGDYLGLFNGFYQDQSIKVFTASGNSLKVPKDCYDWYNKDQILGDIPNELKRFPKGSTIGVMYSWVEGYDIAGKRDGTIWLAFRDTFNIPYYALLTGNTIDTRSLKEQGVQTVEQQIEEEQQQNKTFGEQALDLVKKGFIWGLGAWAVVSLGKTAIQSKSNKSQTPQA